MSIFRRSPKAYAPKYPPIKRPPLEAEVKAYYRAQIATEQMYPWDPPASSQARFFLLQCKHCRGVHTQACPKVAELELYDTGAIKRVVLLPDGEWDDSGVIWLEDVFADDEDEPTPS